MSPRTKAVSFNASAEDLALIRKIVSRGVEAAAAKNVVLDPLSLEMDLVATHANGCPLLLEKLLKSDDFHFTHDITGIMATINRRTGKLGSHFLPRFAIPENELPRKRRARS